MNPPTPPEVLDWLREQGIDPVDIPWDAKPVFSDTTFTIDLYLRNSKGNLYLDEAQEAAVRTITVFPILTQPGRTVREWLKNNPHPEQTDVLLP